MSRLKVKGIKKHFGGVVALVDGTLSIEEGMVVGLLGANGSGKTTLSSIVCGMYAADGGEILFEGVPVTIKNTKDARNLGIAMAHQNLSLISEMTVWENICLNNEPIRKSLIDNKKCMEKARQVLDLLGTPIVLTDKISELSPSQKQIVEIAKAISLNPKLLILDEPTASLEFAQVKKLFEVIGQLKKQGMSIIFISHRMWEVTKICDYAVILRNGATVSMLNLKEIDENKHNDAILTEIMGKSIQKVQERREIKETGAEMLRVENFSVAGAVKDISFSVRCGEIVGVCGLQGMGQEELLLALSGFIPRSGGKVLFFDRERKWTSPKQVIGDGVVLVPGDRHKEGLFLQHTVEDNLLYPEYCKKRSKLILQNKLITKQAETLMDRISLIPRNKNIKANNLSGGNQQKLVVGKWIHQDPNLLLMSDPAKGIDVEARRELYEICREFVEEGKAVLLYASDNHELIDICDRVLVMFEGKIVNEIKKEELSDVRLMEASLHMAGGESV